MQLIQFDTIYSALQEATTVEEIKEGHDKLEALRYYVQQQRLGYEIGYKIAKAKLDYERKGGEILKSFNLNGGDRKSLSSLERVKLSDIDIGHNYSAKWQKVSSLSQQVYQDYLTETLGKKEIPTTNGLLKLCKELKREVERQEQIESIQKAEKATGQYDVIVVDPPWSYEKRPDDILHRAANPYPPMTIEEISALEIPNLAVENCILWLWTTNAFMEEAHEIARMWRFEKKTILTWVKDKMGLGDWLRGQTEHCLMCIKGKPIINLTNQTTVIYGPLRQHSRKPDEFYQLVDELCYGSKLELFSRQEREGWTIHGIEQKF